MHPRGLRNATRLVTLRGATRYPMTVGYLVVPRCPQVEDVLRMLYECRFRTLRGSIVTTVPLDKGYTLSELANVVNAVLPRAHAQLQLVAEDGSVLEVKLDDIQQLSVCERGL